MFSTLQVVPLMLLTLEAWRLRRLPSEALRSLPDAGPEMLKQELNRRVADHGVRVVRCARD